MKLIPFLTASVLLCSSAFAQLTPMPLPPGGFSPPDPILANVSKSKNYGTLIGWPNANLQLGMRGYGTVFVVQDQTQLLGRATAGAKVHGLASLLGHALLGATARFDADAENAQWSYSGMHATVTSDFDRAKAVGFVQLGSYTLLNQTKAYSGDVVSSPSFVNNYTKHIFDVSVAYTIIPLIDITVFIGADAGATLSLTGTLDPMVLGFGVSGSKAKMVGSARGWVTADAGFTVGNSCVNAGLQLDMRLADSRFSGTVTADRSAVTGTITLTEQPLSLLLKAIWGGFCVPNGSKTWWSWAGPIYSVNYVL